MEVFRAAVALIVRSMMLSAQSAGEQRLGVLQRVIAAGDAAGELARLIWDIFDANPPFDRHRIANTVWRLVVFVAASTGRNVL